MTDASSAGERDASPALDESDPELHYEEDEENEDSEDQESEESETSSILSDDSVYPIYEHAESNDDVEFTVYQCCVKNNARLLQQRLHQGVTREEVMELDINGRNGLLVASFKGFVDIVTVLSKCPYLDVNHQDNDGNTALMIAAQAGHITIVNYLLNYYPALELEMRDFRGLTALMKAAVQGRNECVAALLLAETADTENEEKRYLLFLKLLETSEDHAEFQHLVMLLQAWPPMKSINVASASNNPWVKLGTVMLMKCHQEHKESTGNEILKICRSLYGTKYMLSAECIKDLCLLLLNQSLKLPSLKLLVESRDQDLHFVALEQITALSKVDDTNCDAELLSLLLDEKLMVKCISTVYYPHLVNHLLAKQEEGRWNVEEIAKQLQETGFAAEAGSLLMACKGTHPALQTFSAALSAIKHWI